MIEKFVNLCRARVCKFLVLNHTSKLSNLASLLIPKLARQAIREIGRNSESGHEPRSLAPAKTANVNNVTNFHSFVNNKATLFHSCRFLDGNRPSRCRVRLAYWRHVDVPSKISFAAKR